MPGLAMSGLVPLSTIEDDFYVFDEARRNLVGRRTRRMIRLGDKLTVASRQGGQVQEAGGFLPRRRGRQDICDAATGNAAQCSASAAISTRRETPAIIATGKFAPSGFASGQPRNARPSNERPQSSKPAVFQTSGAKFSTTQRPLIKSSGQRFSRRRR
ncbi:MAG: hypothetical protein WDM76_16060 [Limisphaerales bacterium]